MPAHAHAWKKAIAQAELVSVPEAGHMITLEKTEHAAKALAKLG